MKCSYLCTVSFILHRKPCGDVGRVPDWEAGDLCCNFNADLNLSMKHLKKNKTNEQFNFYQLSSVQFSCSVVSGSLRPHESQHARPPCPSPSPGVHSDSRLSSPWCHPAISSSVVPFSSCPQSLPTSEFFPMSQLFAWGGQSTGVSALASFLPKKSQILISFRMD